MRSRHIMHYLWSATVFAGIIGCGAPSADVELVNVSYDPTRELFQEVNKVFTNQYSEKTGKSLKITQSHGGSGSQARAVIDGLKADVVTLALAGDIDQIRKKGLIDEGWQNRLPNHSSPYTSTIVLLVRQGNPKTIRDWPDLIRPDVKVITPNPKTSGGARWNFLAAWGFVTIHQGKGEAEAKEFVRQLFANVPKLDIGARGSTETFLRRKQGDVLIAWENEAILAQKEAPAEGLEIIYPSVSIRAEPPVAIVDKVVAERKTKEAAEAYLQFLYTDEGQEIAGKHGYRPQNAAVASKFAKTLPPIKLFDLQTVIGDWDKAQGKFFADGGVFDAIYQPKPSP